MTNFLICHAAVEGIEYFTDRLGNVFMTKGAPPAGGHYPLVGAHIDSVHPVKPMKIVDAGHGCLRAVDPETGTLIGCGGDDKAGVFICLELLDALPCLKAAFFVGEERYCIGSQGADSAFFKDVGYCLEFDSPQNDIVSFACDGVQLFDEDGLFAKIAVPIMDSHGMNKWQQHPWTDVAILKRRFDFTCINLPAGYYHMHTAREYVNTADVANAIVAGRNLINALGAKKYPYTAPSYVSETKRKTTGLVLERYGH